MILVIDAYNVLKSQERMHDISERQRHHFVMQLVTYAKKKNHTLVVVFDGGPYEWPFESVISKGTVVYSGYNKTADDYIRRYLTEHKQYDLFLISSDRELIRKAKQCNIGYIGGHEFYQKVKEALIEQTPLDKTELIKLTDRDNADIDALMGHAARLVKGVKKEDVEHTSGESNGSPHKKSKTERVLERKIDKL